MAPQYDQAVAALFQGPLDTFVAERKRLAVEIKAGGDKAAASRLDRVARPTISAWAVNQLWRRERADFDVLLVSAGRLRQGDLAALASHREATVKLREGAAAILTAAGHGATEATLRRVTSTLHALAAAGGFAPDPDGALAADRDPPGFDAAGFGVAASPLASRHPVAPKTKTETKTKTQTKTKTERETETEIKTETKARDIAAHVEERERAAAERARQKVEREERDAKRRALQVGLRTARSEVATATSEIARLREALAAAEDRRTRAEAKRDALDVQLAALAASETEG